MIDKTIGEVKVSGGYGGRPSCDWHFDALKRILDRNERDYAH